MVNNIKKILIFTILIIQTIFISGCGNKNEINTLQGTNVIISGNMKNVAYIKNYEVMTCCDEYNIITPLVKNIKNASAYEIYEIDLYDTKSNIIQSNSKLNIQLTISNELLKSIGNKYEVYKLENNELKKIDSTFDSGIITFDDTDLGIYTIVKLGDGNQELKFTINGCDGTCKTCK